jgi:hypothetical protein
MDVFVLVVFTAFPFWQYENSCTRMDDGNSVTTRLLTLLNVSAVKSDKRKRIYEDLSCSTEKLNKRRVTLAENVDKVDAGTIESKTVPESQREDVSGQDVEVEGNFRFFCQ